MTLFRLRPNIRAVVMMVMNDKNQKCILISNDDAEQDAAGFVDESEETTLEQEVWCKVASVSGKEIATMGQNTIKPALKVTLWAEEYNDQDSVEIDGLLYGVYRTYRPGQDEIELYLERKGGVSRSGDD